jgi:ferredoxin
MLYALFGFKMETMPTAKYTIWVLALVVGLGSGFVPPSAGVNRVHPVVLRALEQDSDVSTVDRQFEDIAKKLRLSVLHNGFESKDPEYGVESISATIPIEPSLGLELVEVARGRDGRGLVLVSHVGGNAAEHTSIQVGDSIVGVSCEAASFRTTVAGQDYDVTIDAICAAKTHAQLMSSDSITLQLNRLVRRAKVQVIVEGDRYKKPIALEGLAGDNLRLLLIRNKLVDFKVYQGSNCGGGGSCGTCKVQVLDGEAFLDNLMPKSAGEGDSPDTSLRKACQTVIGANNQKSTLRLRLS